MPKSDGESNAAAASTVNVLEQDLSNYEQRLVNLILSANDVLNSSDPEVLVSFSMNLEKAGYAFLDTGHALFTARKRVRYAFSEEPVESIYHNLLQRRISAMGLLKNRHYHLAEVKIRQSALDESRQNLSTLLDNVYYASHNENDISTVEHIINKIDSSVTLMSQQLKSLADSDNDLYKQDSLLI